MQRWIIFAIFADVISYEWTIFGLIARLADLLTVINKFILLRGFSLSVVFIKIGHQFIETKLERIKFFQHTSSNYMLICRTKHYQLVQLSDFCDQTFSLFVSTQITTLFPTILILFYNLIFEELTGKHVTLHLSSALQLVYYCYIVLEFSLILYYSPTICHEAIYRSSIVDRPEEFKVQVSLLIDFINRQKFGINYMYLFLITPNSLTTLLAVGFTYLLAVPNFFQSDVN